MTEKYFIRNAFVDVGTLCRSRNLRPLSKTSSAQIPTVYDILVSVTFTTERKRRFVKVFLLSSSLYIII